MLRHRPSSSLLLSIEVPSLPNTQIICMSDKFQEGDGLEPEFQTAFPEDTKPRETDEEFDRRMEEAQSGEVLCHLGCGRPGQYFASGPQGGELPRCSRKLTDCPVVGRTAIKAAKKAGRLGRRWVSR